ncbi:hypothetical protein A4G28_26985 [Mycobacterium ostraviense]|uniref:Major capsid protein n=2 Tax=Mycobacterium ostraviense TaxID=2738409 RepID=A0A162D5N9_9MYCO|nr:hypothetical protein A4G28_26985 [Mycobacterium ostraviense]
MRNTKGISVASDVLVNETADGVNLQLIWQEIQTALELYNEHRSTIVRLLSYQTIAVADVIPQSVESESFEIATEQGIPRALREPADYLPLGYNFQNYDLRLGATWKWLRSATAEQVTAQVTRIFEADNRLVSGTILRRLLDPAPRTNEWGHQCYGLWSGDGMVPPAHLGQTFDGAHTHYLTSGSTHIDSADIEDMIKHVIHHGYGRFGAQGGQLVILAHPDQVEDITFWRTGVEYAAGKTPKWDFVPSAAQPAYFTTEHLVGAIPPTDFNGLRVLGSYGDAWLIESHYVPSSYVIVAATGGLDSDMNPVGFREHVNPAYHGLRHIPGRGPYPLVDSFYARGFGVGVRHRGAAVVMQVTENAAYTPPTIQT